MSFSSVYIKYIKFEVLCFIHPSFIVRLIQGKLPGRLPKCNWAKTLGDVFGCRFSPCQGPHVCPSTRMPRHANCLASHMIMDEAGIRRIRDLPPYTCPKQLPTLYASGERNTQLDAQSAPSVLEYPRMLSVH